RDFAFPTREKQFPAWDFAFPHGKRDFCADFAFPAREKQFPARDFAFPAQEKRFPARHFAFPAREKRFPVRDFAFPHGKSDFLCGISLFHTGKAISPSPPMIAKQTGIELAEASAKRRERFRLSGS